MTVILSAFIPDRGFMLAADGRRHDGQTGEKTSDKAQKIFPAEHPDCKFMFAWAGVVALRTPFDPNFDFASQTLAFCKDMSSSRFGSWSEFLDALKWRIFGSLLRGLGDRQAYTKDIPRDDVIAAVELVGYFHGKPVHAVIKFWHQNGVLGDPAIQELCELESGRRPEIGNLTRESFFEKIVTECPDSLPGAVKLAEEYIRICSERSQNYGGRTHIATQTPNGFEWKLAPLES